MENLAYYIGVDHREADALRVAESSVRAYASKPIHVGHLEHQDLRNRQLFDRPWRIAEDGSYWDERDGKPFSVQFSHTRFLGPLVARDEGHRDWCLVGDCDWLWLDDIWKILQEADPTKTALVVPHDFRPAATVKMDGRVQSRYHRKLWSALVLWNLNSKKLPTVEMVNAADGGYLHGFGWLDDSDIGYLSESWHWVPGASPTSPMGVLAQEKNRPLPINAVHFTTGVPGMANREPTPFDRMYMDELTTATRNRF